MTQIECYKLRVTFQKKKKILALISASMATLKVQKKNWVNKVRYRIPSVQSVLFGEVSHN